MSCPPANGEGCPTPLDPIVAGDSWLFSGELLQVQDDAPINLTDAEIQVTLKENETDADPGALQYSEAVPPGANAAAGIFAITVPSSLTGVDPGDYFLFLRAIWPGSPPVRWTFVRQTITVVSG